MFHLAMSVADLEASKKFYKNVLKAKMGRSGYNWADFNFHGNQITLVEINNFIAESPKYNKDGVPLKHFGVVLTVPEWQKEKTRFEEESVPFLIKSHIVFKGKVGEQHSFLISDPNGYAIEYKGFENLESVFKKS